MENTGLLEGVGRYSLTDILVMRIHMWSLYVCMCLMQRTMCDYVFQYLIVLP